MAALFCSPGHAALLSTLCAGVAPLSWHQGPGCWVLTFTLGLPRLVHASQAGATSCQTPSWVTQAGPWAVAVGGYAHPGKARGHRPSLLTAVFQYLFSLSREPLDVS